MSEALLYHVQEGKELNRIKTELENENMRMKHENDLNSVIVKEKILQAKNQAVEVWILNKITGLKAALQTMENSLSHVVQEFEQERLIIGQVAKLELEEVKKVVKDLSARLHAKTVEMRHIKV